MNGQAYIGTSGWSYDHWKTGFYAGKPKRDWLKFCAEQFSSIEINASFYRLQKAETYIRWCYETPAGFRFALKANRYLTHNKKLADPDEAIKREKERAINLGDKLIIVLWQLPAHFKKNIVRLESFCQALSNWSEVRHCIEFRHPSWFDREISDSMEKYQMSICQSDAGDWEFWPAVTSETIYIRLHGHEQTYRSDYTLEELKRWASKINSWLIDGRNVHVYFNNDAMGAAPYNAKELINLIS